jgi:CHASE2 domain-containing sensor protein
VGHAVHHLTNCSHTTEDPELNQKTTAAILFVLALVMLILGWVIQGLPPVVTAVGFAVIGYHILRSKP